MHFIIIIIYHGCLVNCNILITFSFFPVFPVSFPAIFGREPFFSFLFLFCCAIECSWTKMKYFFIYTLLYYIKYIIHIFLITIFYIYNIIYANANGIRNNWNASAFLFRFGMHFSCTASQQKLWKLWILSHFLVFRFKCKCECWSLRIAGY